MKKLLFIALGIGMLALTSPAMAQGFGALTTSNGLALDTVTNTASKNLTIGTTGKAKFDGSASFVIVITKISGTVGGTANLFGSNNGTDWAAIGTAYTVTDATQQTKFDFDRSKYLYYRVTVTGTGTMSASVKGAYYYKAAFAP